MPKAFKRRTAVCLFSTHPLVVPQLCRFFARAPFQPRPLAIGPTAAKDVRRIPIPAAPLYVVDDFGTYSSTEALVSSIRARRSHARVIVLLDHLENTRSSLLLRLGVKGLVKLSDAEEQLARAAKLVVQGGLWVPRPVLSRFVDSVLAGTPAPAPTKPDYLRPREKQVVDCLLKNLSNKEIANALNISQSTVKFHVANIFTRYGIQRRADLILQSFQERGFVQ